MKKSILLSVFILLFALFNTINAQTSTSELIAMIGGKSSGEITISEIVGEQLVVNNNEYEVVGFSFSYKVGGAYISNTVEGNRSKTRGMLINIEQVEDGEDVYYRNIKCKHLETEKIIELPELTFTFRK